MKSSAIQIRGVDLDEATRCAHYHSAVDVIALRFGCCAEYYACHTCHEELADHCAQVWPAQRFDEPAVYCGACHQTLTAREYLEQPDRCLRCATNFNPGCKLHHHLYFEQSAGD